MSRRPIQSIEELRASLAEAIPPQHRTRAVAVGRLVLAALEGSAPEQGPAASPGTAGVAGAPAAPQPAPPTPPQPPPLTPTFERILKVLRRELDRRGIELPEVRRRSRIPFVPLRPRQASGAGDD